MLDKDFGSGYPSDERCVKWCDSSYVTFTANLMLAVSCVICDRLERNQHRVFGYPSEIMRFSWSTSREVLDRLGAAKVEWYVASEHFCICLIVLYVNV